MLDRRTAPRSRTLLEGRIEIQKLNGWAVECSVRNLSDEGACITVPDHIVVPPAFQLGISGEPPRDARLVWVGGGRAGVAFTSLAAESKMI